LGYIAKATFLSNGYFTKSEKPHKVAEKRDFRRFEASRRQTLLSGKVGYTPKDCPSSGRQNDGSLKFLNDEEFLQ
jgi:hypothetical protein